MFNDKWLLQDFHDTCVLHLAYCRSSDDRAMPLDEEDDDHEAFDDDEEEEDEAE